MSVSPLSAPTVSRRRYCGIYCLPIKPPFSLLGGDRHLWLSSANVWWLNNISCRMLFIRGLLSMRRFSARKFLKVPRFWMFTNLCYIYDFRITSQNLFCSEESQPLSHPHKIQTNSTLSRKTTTKSDFLFLRIDSPKC